MALPIINNWKKYYNDFHEGLGSSYERIIINNLLDEIHKDYEIKTVLEAPIFGFTGVTGLNSVHLTKKGCDITLVDNDVERTELVKKLLSDMIVSCDIIHTDSFNDLPLTDKSIDFSWNFSSLWFVENLERYIQELIRITNKAILICVPNQSGLGYKWQKANSEVPKEIIFNEDYINPEIFVALLKENEWKLVKHGYFDCPLWPDIGMSKESFLHSIISRKNKKDAQFINVKNPISIIDYYKGKDDGFPARMMKYSFFEKYAPLSFKRVWSHHRWFLFVPDK